MTSANTSSMDTVNTETSVGCIKLRKSVTIGTLVQHQKFAQNVTQNCAESCPWKISVGMEINVPTDIHQVQNCVYKLMQIS